MFQLHSDSFEHLPNTGAKVRARLEEKAVHFHDAVLNLLWDWSQDAQMISDGEFTLWDGMDHYKKLLDAYPEGPTREVTLADHHDADPHCKFTAVMTVGVRVTGEWAFSAQNFFAYRASTDEHDVERHDIERMFTSLYIDAKTPAALKKLEAWIDLQGFVAKTAGVELSDKVSVAG